MYQISRSNQLLLRVVRKLCIIVSYSTRLILSKVLKMARLTARGHTSSMENIRAPNTITWENETNLGNTLANRFDEALWVLDIVAIPPNGDLENSIQYRIEVFIKHTFFQQLFATTKSDGTPEIWEVINNLKSTLQKLEYWGELLGEAEQSGFSVTLTQHRLAWVFHLQSGTNYSLQEAQEQSRNLIHRLLGE